MRILIVDDDPSLLHMLQDGIEMFCADCQVTSATDGFTALEQLQRQPFDLVLTDYDLPGMDGLELAQVARQTLPQARVVLMTAYGDGAAFQHGIHVMGLEDYLSKPFSLKQVRELVEGTPGQVA